MCCSISSAHSRSSIRASTHCSGAGSLLISRLLLLDIGFALGEGMHVGDGELADPRRDAIDVAQWWHGGDYLADDIVEHVHHRQERRVKQRRRYHGTRVAAGSLLAMPRLLGLL